MEQMDKCWTKAEICIPWVALAMAVVVTESSDLITVYQTAWK